MAANAAKKDLELVTQLMKNLKMDALPDGDDVHTAAAEAENALRAVPSCGSPAEWAALLFDRMNGAADANDAMARAAGLLEAFEGSVVAVSRAERDVAVSQNGVLKKAFLVQYRLLVAQKAENQELQRQIAECQQRVRNLEEDNYALSVHLRQAQQPGSSIPGHFNPDIF